MGTGLVLAAILSLCLIVTKGKERVSNAFAGGRLRVYSQAADMLPSVAARSHPARATRSPAAAAPGILAAAGEGAASAGHRSRAPERAAAETEARRRLAAVDRRAEDARNPGWEREHRNPAGVAEEHRSLVGEAEGRRSCRPGAADAASNLAVAAVRRRVVGCSRPGRHRRSSLVEPCSLGWGPYREGVLWVMLDGRTEPASDWQ